MRHYRTFNILIGISILALPAFLWAIMKADTKVEPVISITPTTVQASEIPHKIPSVIPASSADSLLEAVSSLEADQDAHPEESDLLADESVDELAVEDFVPEWIDEADSETVPPAYSMTAATDQPIVVSNSTGSASYASSSESSGSNGGSDLSTGISGGSGGASSGSGSGGGAASVSSPTESSSTITGGGGGIPQDLYKSRNIAGIFLPDEEIDSGMPYSQALNNMLKYDAYWYAQVIAGRQPQVWRTLRTNYPDRLAMYYATACTVKKGVSGGYLDFDYVEQYHPEWFLLIDDKNATVQDYRDWDKRMRWNPDNPADTNYNRFFLDVGNPDFQNWAVGEFLKRLDPVTGLSARIRYSGLAADNVLLTTWAYWKKNLYPNWKYAAKPSEWNQAYFSYLQKLHDALQKKGYILLVNPSTYYGSRENDSEWQELTAVVDGVMNESAMAVSSLWGEEKWECCLYRHEEIIKKGLYDWWMFRPFGSDLDEWHEQFLYVYCSFLLVSNEKLSLFGTLKPTGDPRSVPWYDEYTLPLGKSVGLRYQRQDCWFRDYQYGKVVVNPSDVRCTIPLDSDRYTFDWRTKKEISRLTLEPYSATILLPTGYSID